MRHEDLFYVLALLKVEGVGDIVAKKLLSISRNKGQHNKLS